MTIAYEALIILVCIKNEIGLYMSSQEFEIETNPTATYLLLDDSRIVKESVTLLA